MSTRDRNFTRLGVVTITILALVVGAALNLGTLGSFFHSSYAAAFADASGLRAGDDVRVSGVRVGEVRTVAFEGTHVRVEFTSDVRFGDASHAAIRTATLLGTRFLELEPSGSGNRYSSQEIPLSHTSVPYDVTTALSDLTDTSAALDTTQLTQAFKVLTKTFANTPASVREVLQGTKQLAKVVAARNDELRQLLNGANGVTAVLAERKIQITQTISDSNKLLSALVARRDSIETLVGALHSLSAQVEGAVHDNKSSLRPALRKLHTSLSLIDSYLGNISKSIEGVAGFLNGIGEGVGSAPFFQAFVGGLSPVSLKPSLTELFQTGAN